MTKPKYHVIVWGKAEDSTSWLDGEMHAFETVAELNAWLMLTMPQPHKNEAAAGQCMLQLQDGRSCIIIKGHAKTIKQSVSVRVG